MITSNVFIHRITPYIILLSTQSLNGQLNPKYSICQYILISLKIGKNSKKFALFSLRAACYSDLQIGRKYGTFLKI